MDMNTLATLDKNYQGNQILGIIDIGYFAGQGRNAGSARQRLNQRKN
jgi:hypothetical protein